MTSNKPAIYFASGVATLALAQIVHRYAREWWSAKKRDLRSPLPANPTLPAELETELYSRNAFFFGDEGFQAIKNSFVIVVGLGGVGSHAAHMLARSGIKKLRIIDFDQVSLSSLNRHATATLEDVGRPKASSLKNRLLQIIPDAQIDARCQMFNAEDADDLLSGSPAYVLDCIDDPPTKCELLARCSGLDIPVISSMGAGCRSDPTRLCIASLLEASRDRLAAKLRWTLRKKHKVDSRSIMCVFSTQDPVNNLLPLSSEQEENPGEYGAVENFRVRVLPVLGTLPAIFGQAMATWVLCQIGGKPFQPSVSEKITRSVRHKLQQHLMNRERERWGARCRLEFSDVDYVVTQMWKNRCAVTGVTIKGAAVGELSRWHLDKPCTPNNIVLVCTTVLAKLEDTGLTAFTAEQIAKVEEVLSQQNDCWGV